jgi:GT2 family glycosyltransferase
MPAHFAVVTPTRNALEKLRRCVGSVRGQVGVSLQHLVQDACSDDGTPEWLARQTGIDWRSEPDAGMYDAINRGWRRSDGAILSWLNSDEQYLPGTLTAVGRYFEQHPKIDFLFGDVLVIDGNGHLIAARRETRLSRAYIANGFLNAHSCTMFFRRRLWDEGLLQLDERYRYAADMDLVLRLFEAGKCHAKLPAYLSAFALDGTNLSCHPRMLEETAEIQRRHRAWHSPWMRRLVTSGRHAERLAGGCYRKVDIEYAYAEDERPSYRTVKALAVGGTYDTR